MMDVTSYQRFKRFCRFVISARSSNFWSAVLRRSRRCAPFACSAAAYCSKALKFWSTAVTASVASAKSHYLLLFYLYACHKAIQSRPQPSRRRGGISVQKYIYDQEVIGKGATDRAAVEMLATLNKHADLHAGKPFTLQLHALVLCISIDVSRLVTQGPASWMLQAVPAVLRRNWPRHCRRSTSYRPTCHPSQSTLL